MPAIEPGYTIQLAAQDLIMVLKNGQNKAPIDLNERHTAALRKLAQLFNSMTAVDDGENENAQLPRVIGGGNKKTTEPSSSHDTTALRVVSQQKRIHQQTTRNNTPVSLIEEVNENEVEQDAIEQASATTQIEQIIAPPMPTPEVPPKQPQRTIANYRCEREAKRRATEALKKATPQHITEDEDEANCVERIFQPLPRLHNTSTPCNTIQHTVYHLMGIHLENKNGPDFIPGRLNNSASRFETEIDLEHCSNGVVHLITVSRG